MCNPVTALTAASAGIGLLGTGVKAIGEAHAADQKAAEDRQNQQLAEMQATDAMQRGEAMAARIRMQGGQVQAKQATGFAASGIDAGVGSAAQVQAAAAGMTELDARTAMNNAAREAWGHRVTAANYGKQAVLDAQAGRQAESGALLGGLGELAGAAGGVYGMGKKTGAF